MCMTSIMETTNLYTGAKKVLVNKVMSYKKPGWTKKKIDF